MEEAECRGKAPKDGTVEAHPWFPKRGQSQRPAKDICAPCSVKAECGDYARRTGSDHGMWGGQMQRRRN